MSNSDLQVPTLQLTEGNTGQVCQVDQLDLHDSFKTLGIHKTISGNQSAQIKTMTMKDKSDAYDRSILSVNVSPSEAWTGLFSI